MFILKRPKSICALFHSNCLITSIVFLILLVLSAGVSFIPNIYFAIVNTKIRVFVSVSMMFVMVSSCVFLPILLVRRKAKESELKEYGISFVVRVLILLVFIISVLVLSTNFLVQNLSEEKTITYNILLFSLFSVGIFSLVESLDKKGVYLLIYIISSLIVCSIVMFFISILVEKITVGMGVGIKAVVSALLWTLAYYVSHVYSNTYKEVFSPKEGSYEQEDQNSY